MALQLYVGNKNYSSWSMRPWVLLKQAGIPFDEVMIRFDSFDVDSVFKQRLRAVSPLGKVPVLVDDGCAIWTRWPLPSTSPSTSPRSSCGLPMRAPVPARAVSAPKCTAASAHCATTVP
jgi:glutathione S-transferase